MRRRRLLSAIVTTLVSLWILTRLINDGQIHGWSSNLVLGDFLGLACVLGLGFAYHAETRIGEINAKRADLNRERATAAEKAFLELSNRLLQAVEPRDPEK